MDRQGAMRFSPVMLGTIAMLAVVGYAFEAQARCRWGISLAPFLTFGPRQTTRAVRVWVPGQNETWYTWEDVPGHWQTIRRTVHTPGRMVQKYVQGKYIERVLPTGYTVKTCIRPGYYKQVWEPPVTHVFEEQVWVPASRRRVPHTRLAPGRYETRLSTDVDWLFHPRLRFGLYFHD